MRFVITGTGRCGTTYMALVLRRTGLRVGHELWFRPYPAGLRDPSVLDRNPSHEVASRTYEMIRRRGLRLDGDVSWEAVPRLDRFNGTVLLQLRHPLKVIGSFAGAGFFNRPRPEQPIFKNYMRAHFDPSGDELVDGMRWWVDWNTRAAKYASFTYRIEDLDEALLADILTHIGHTASPERLTAALNVPEDKRNTGPAPCWYALHVDWSDLPRGLHFDALCEAAAAWGYDVP
ncbi:MAG: hypothetical protein KY395_02030 [Actinobacteria bacterium]|nr:hypothetical protein [Actinomycetota bacterium]